MTTATQQPTASARLTVADINPTERTPCEVYTRVMGYHRPVTAFNAGKQQEHRDRAYFSNAKAGV